jgi:hypothetical protein
LIDGPSLHADQLCVQLFSILICLFVFTVFSQDAELLQPVSLEVQPFDDLLTFDQPLDASLADIGEFYKFLFNWYTLLGVRVFLLYM